MTTYTVKQYMRELDKRAKEIKQSDMVFLAASGIHPDYIDRIFTKGLDANNRPHGLYSTKPLYVNTKTKSPKALQPKGKTGKTSFESTGKPHKTTYFARGYRQFKQSIGRGTRVNFRLFGDLQLDLTNGIRKLKGKAQLVVKREFNRLKIENLVDKYGLISFRISKKEREKFLDLLRPRLNKIMNGA